MVSHELRVGSRHAGRGGLGVHDLAHAVSLVKHGLHGGAEGAEGLVRGRVLAGLGGHDDVEAASELGREATPVRGEGLPEPGEPHAALPAREAEDVGPAAPAGELDGVERLLRRQHRHDGVGGRGARLGRRVAAEHEGAGGRGGDGGQEARVEPGRPGLQRRGRRALRSERTVREAAVGSVGGEGGAAEQARPAECLRRDNCRAATRFNLPLPCQCARARTRGPGRSALGPQCETSCSSQMRAAGARHRLRQWPRCVPSSSLFGAQPSPARPPASGTAVAT